MVLYLRDFRRLWQRVVEMAFPASRILAIALTVNFRQSSTSSMRDRILTAVLVFVSQIGFNTFNTSMVSIAATGSPPITG
jgi:hypothetical protein